MIDSAVRSYIKQALVQGTTTKEITTTLVRAGWSQSDINLVITEVYAEFATKPVIRVEGITKSFGNAVLEDMYVHIQQGEIFGIIGSSGVGKTTFLNMLVGFYTPDKGDIILHDGKQSISVFKNSVLVKRVVGFSTQTPSVYHKLTVFENLMHFGSLYNLTDQERRSRSRTLIKLIGLEGNENKLAAHLSGGMIKRLDIACALMHNPRVLILDEPTADLDPVTRKALWSLVREINKRGTTIIIASHFLGEIEHLCTRIGVLRNKTLANIGTADELKDLYTKSQIMHVELHSKNYQAIIRALQQRKLCEQVEQKEHSLVLRTDKAEEALAVVTQVVQQTKDKLHHISVSRPSMQEVFTELVKK